MSEVNRGRGLMKGSYSGVRIDWLSGGESGEPKVGLLGYVVCVES